MKVINFYGGAAIGKSTIAADMYSKLKRMGFCTELVGEFAKWLWYQHATEIVEDQLYLSPSRPTARAPLPNTTSTSPSATRRCL